MANIKKTFNFRNGVQVDEDNLIVNATGLVGIGTTIPTETLDVRGTTKVVGLVTSQEGFVGVFTAHTSSLGIVALSTSIIGAGVSIKSGIITSNAASGLVTYYGDARFLQGMPTSQWEDTNTGLGVSSIYNTGGTVGVGTTNPQFTLQVGSNVNGGEHGVGISSAGNIKASGIVTAKSLDLAGGDLTVKKTINTLYSPTTNITSTALIRNDAGINNTYSGLKLQAHNNAGAAAIFNIAVLNSSDNYKSSLVFQSRNSETDFSERLRIDQSGNVGINTTVATATLDVKGTIKATTVNATNVNIVGLSTHRVPFTNASDNLTDSEDLTFNDTANVLNIVGTTDTDQLNVSGVSTFNDDVYFVGSHSDTSNNRVHFDQSAGGGAFNIQDRLKLQIGTNAIAQLQVNPALGTTVTFNSRLSNNHLHVVSDHFKIKSLTGDEKYLEAEVGVGVTLYTDNVKRFETNEVGVTVYNQLDTTNIVASGVITATTELNSPLVGVGTDDPATDIQVRKAGAAQIRVTSDTDAAIVSVGRVSGAANGTNAAFRHGNNAVAFPYSNPNALDIINYDTGNVNFYLSVSNAGNAQGDFHWHKGGNTSRLMTLTNSGNLGIGITNPTHKLSVAGLSTFTANAWFNNSVTVVNDLTVKDDLTVDGSFTAGSINANITGNLTGNVNAASGLSTHHDLKVNRFIGIGVDADTSNPIKVNTSVNSRFGVDYQGKVYAGINAPRCGIDFGNASADDASKRFMIPPSVTSTQRDALTGLVEGALIWQSTDKRLEYYNGTAWRQVSNAAI